MKEAGAPEAPRASTSRLFGVPEMSGLVVSRTVTVNPRCFSLPAASTATQSKVVMPSGKKDPEESPVVGRLVQVTERLPLTRSVAVGAV